MTSRVVWVTQDVPYKEMAAALHENRVSAFPVLDDEGKVIGVVSEADLLTKEALDGGYDGMPGMITGLRLPVVDSDGHLIGIISRADVLSVLDRSDHEIRTDGAFPRD